VPLNSAAPTALFSRSNDFRVLLLPPTRRDGEVTRAFLERAGLSCALCDDAASLAAQIGLGMGAVVITDALATDPQLPRVIEALAGQPSWSDVPTIVLTRTDLKAAATTRLLDSLLNVTVLDRPTSSRTLVSAVHAAIRGRRRQYELRDQLDVLRRAEEALRNADRRKDEFLAMLAHELRNPLAPIRTASELLARAQPLDPRSQSAVAIVQRQVTHLTRLVDDLLDVSRITQGRIELQRRPLEMAAIIAQAMESVEPLLREKRHKVILVASRQPLYVHGDSARLVQCLTNLLTNAAKYTDPGGEVRLELREEQGTAVVSVTDNGVGIPGELLPQIFELFVQSARSLDRSEGGLGIGLSVVQRLIQMHGGQVSAASGGPGLGSTFEIRLPVIAAPSQPVPTSVRAPVLAKRVLVVDDNVDAAVSLAEVLKLDGHTVEAVHSAKAALQSSVAFSPEVILLDIGLPDMDGYQVAQRIRSTGGNVILIALTGYGQIEDIERARIAGFDAHLVKPVDLTRLQRVISGLEAPVNLSASNRRGRGKAPMASDR
jgi:two-component system, sensor histidine kinase